MQDQNPLIFKYEEIKELGGLNEKLSPAPELFADAFDRPGTLEKLALELGFSVGGDSVLLEGKLTAELQLECARCGEAVRRSFEDSFDEVYPDSLEYIDTREIIRETVALLTPIKILCSDDCKGRCLVCGTNRNQKACGCRQELPTQFGALKDLRLKGPDKPGK